MLPLGLVLLPGALLWRAGRSVLRTSAEHRPPAGIVGRPGRGRALLGDRRRAGDRQQVGAGQGVASAGGPGRLRGGVRGRRMRCRPHARPLGEARRVHVGQGEVDPGRLGGLAGAAGRGRDPDHSRGDRQSRAPDQGGVRAAQPGPGRGRPAAAGPARLPAERVRLGDRLHARPWDSGRCRHHRSRRRARCSARSRRSRCWRRFPAARTAQFPAGWPPSCWPCPIWPARSAACSSCDWFRRPSSTRPPSGAFAAARSAPSCSASSPPSPAARSVTAGCRPSDPRPGRSRSWRRSSSASRPR